jgi:hypothetical protein
MAGDDEESYYLPITFSYGFTLFDAGQKQGKLGGRIGHTVLRLFQKTPWGASSSPARASSAAQSHLPLLPPPTPAGGPPLVGP